MRSGVVLGGRGAQGRPQDAPGEITYTFGRLFWPKMGPKGSIWDAFWVQNLSKIDAKIDEKIDAEKIEKMMPT